MVELPRNFLRLGLNGLSSLQSEQWVSVSVSKFRTPSDAFQGDKYGIPAWVTIFSVVATKWLKIIFAFYQTDVNGGTKRLSTEWINKRTFFSFGKHLHRHLQFLGHFSKQKCETWGIHCCVKFFGVTLPAIVIPQTQRSTFWNSEFRPEAKVYIRHKYRLSFYACETCDPYLLLLADSELWNALNRTTPS